MCCKQRPPENDFKKPKNNVNALRLIKSDTQSKKKLKVKITLKEKTCPIQSYTHYCGKATSFHKRGLLSSVGLARLDCVMCLFLAACPTIVWQWCRGLTWNVFHASHKYWPAALSYPSKGYPWASCWPPDHLLDSLSVKVSHAADSSLLQNLSSGMVPVPTGQGWSCCYHLSRMRVNTYPPTGNVLLSLLLHQSFPPPQRALNGTEMDPEATTKRPAAVRQVRVHRACLFIHTTLTIACKRHERVLSKYHFLRELGPFRGGLWLHIVLLLPISH